MAKAEEEREKKFKGLFEGKKFYISREVPRDALVFIIRFPSYIFFLITTLILEYVMPTNKQTYVWLEV